MLQGMVTPFAENREVNSLLSARGARYSCKKTGERRKSKESISMRNTLFALTVLVASCALVTTANVNAQTVPAGCFKIEGGQTFCPKPEGLAPTATPTAPATPLDQEIQQAMAKGEKVVAVMNKYSHASTTGPIPSTDWGFVNWFWALLALLVVGGVILALVRRNHVNNHTDNDGEVIVPVRVRVNEPDPIDIDLDARLRNGVPALAPAPAGTPCPGCTTPKPTMTARFCAVCGHVLPMIMFVLLLFGAVGQTVSAQTANEVWVWGKVNGIQGWLSQIVNPTPAPAVTPASKSAVSAPAPSPVRRNVAPPAPRPVVQPQLTADDIRRAVMEGVKAAMPTTQPTPTVINPPTMMSATPNNSAPAPSGLGQQVVDRLVAVEGRQNLLASRQVELGGRLTTAEERLVTLRDNQNADHETLAEVGAAAITDSKSNKCKAYRRLVLLKMINPDELHLKGCKAQ